MKNKLLICFLFLSLPLCATHLKSGFITAERVSCINRTFRITITVFTDPGSPVKFGGEQDILDFGDGTRILVPETPNTILPGFPNVGIASFSILHTYAGAARYTISYLEPNRNEGVLNMDNSVLTTFYTETQIDLSVPGCSNSPRLLIPLVEEACSGVAFFHNPGAFDPDGDSLSYELVTPFRDRGLPVVNYRDPHSPVFYSGLDYNQASEEENGPPTFSIDPIDGTLVWDAPGHDGEYNIAYSIKEWRKINGTWINIGSVRVDRQIIVSDCSNERPKLTVPDDLCVTAGSTINAAIFGQDLSNHPVKIEAFSEIFNPAFISPAGASPNPAIFQSSDPSAELAFTWNTVCDHVREQPYRVTLKITDDPADGPNLVTYQTWLITVTGPPPAIQSATINLANQHATLTWDVYSCENASSMQVWRRVDDISFVDECQSGMNPTLGFSLLATLPIEDALGVPITTYTDTNGGKGLTAGGKYCYRLVAVFPGGKSSMSNEICLDPVLADEPVVTNINVTKTGDTNGEIIVQWTPPFDIDAVQFPGPYQYIVQRANTTGFENVSSKIADLIFTDTGLDTYDESYSYRVLLFSSSSTNPIDTSSVASSPRLVLNAELNRIQLDWSAQVPWSNQIENYPLHEIYRGEEGEDELTLIDVVNVLQDGFTYTDEGKLAPGDSLDDNKIYCYRIMMRGGYGNPSIATPQINFSQINCVQPLVVGVEDELIPLVEIYPNPAQNYIKVEFQDIGPLEILLYDYQGKLQLRQRVNESVIIDLYNLANGLYLCDVRKGNRSIRKMRIIKR